jgi:NADPH-dependent 2,4-dienoyl-CoA reductase/sulfur reductase-like enzyme/rhodanese-related sulfurtransferase
MKLLIIGGVAGGASAAARARRLSEDAAIILFERGPHVSFANCGLPYYVSGHIAERNKLFVTTAQRLRERFNLDVRTLSDVEAIDPVTKRVQVRNLGTGEVYFESYDKIILAPGAAPLKPAIVGIDLPGIFTLRNVEDVDRIKAQVDQTTKQAVLLGGGFISIELAENLHRKGIATTLVERNDQLLTPFDKEMTAPVLQALKSRGIQVLLRESAVRFERTTDGLEVVLESGKRLPTQVVLLGVGVRPENGLAVSAALEIGPRGGIRVNANMQTSDPNIYAVGDAVETTDALTGERTQIPLAGPANRQGRLAANHIFTGSGHYRGTQGTAILGFYEQTIAMTGASEKSLLRAKQPYRKVYIHPANHAGYYPGAEGMSLKLLFDPSNGRILGAQGVGGSGVDKRIDVLSMAIQGKMTVYDLEEAELAYAPQFGSAKDPINMLGFVASGLLRGEHPQVDLEEVLNAEPGKYRILDVRTAEEFAAGQIPNAVNLPVDELRERLGELPRDREIAAYCQVGQRGYLATRILMQAGFKVVNISGGYRTYRLHHPG